MIDAGEIDAVTFTSASTVHGFTGRWVKSTMEKYVRSASGDRRSRCGTVRDDVEISEQDDNGFHGGEDFKTFCAHG